MVANYAAIMPEPRYGDCIATLPTCGSPRREGLSSHFAHILSPHLGPFVIYPFLRSRILPPPPDPGSKDGGSVSLSPRQQRVLDLLRSGHLGAIATGSAAALLVLQVSIRGDLAWITSYIVGGFTLAMCVACWLYINWQARQREQQQKQAPQ